MNYNSLYSKYQTLIQKENDLQSNTDYLLLGCKKIVTESERVAQVARDSEQILRKLDYEFSVATKITNQTDMMLYVLLARSIGFRFSLLPSSLFSLDSLESGFSVNSSLFKY